MSHAKSTSPGRAFVLALSLLWIAGGCVQPENSVLTVAPQAHLLIIAPHPDDETLGAGGLIQRVRAGGGAVRIIYMTSGDGFIEAVRFRTGKAKPAPADFVQYGETRRKEAIEASRVFGLTESDLIFVEFPDGGLRPLLDAHWSLSKPFVSPETAASHPPDRNAYDETAVYSGAALLGALGRAVAEFHPTLLALPDPRDRHPDHAATSIFTLLLMRERLRLTGQTPKILLYMTHWPNWPPGWDGKSKRSPNSVRGFPRSVPDIGLPTESLMLLPAEMDLKRESLHRYRTQESIMSPFLEAFVTSDEPFLVMDEIDRDEISRLIVALR